MKLVRYGEPGHEKPGLIDAEGRIRDLSAQVDDIDGHALTDDALDLIRGVDHRTTCRWSRATPASAPVSAISASSSASA